MNKTGTAGNQGADIRSDCHVTLELTSSGGIQIDLTSKIGVLFGESINTLTHDILAHFGIENAHITIADRGALDFVLAARIEAAVHQVIETDKEFWPELLPQNQYAQAGAQRRDSYPRWHHSRSGRFGCPG